MDILVNDAAMRISVAASCSRELAADSDGVIETQLNAVFLLSKLAAAAMVTRQRGKIINVGSMYSFFGSGLIPLLQRRKGGGHPADQIDGHRIGAAQHSGQCRRSGFIETEMTTPVQTYR